MTLAPGDLAPTFNIPNQTGQMISLTDFKGRPVALYFYPKDMTPGCTQEAIDFRDLMSEFSAKNAIILGVSKDSVASHKKFHEKYQLPFDLLSDKESDVCERYGVWVEKSMYGKKYWGIERTTILINAEGKIEQLWRKVSVPGHVQNVCAIL